MFILISKVIAIAANKSDLFDKEQVPENEARNFATEIGAFFNLTSCCSNTGIEELFKDIGLQILGQKYEEKEEERRNKFYFLLKWAKY